MKAQEDTSLTGQVEVLLPTAVSHGFDYLVRDPGAGGSKGVYPLKEFGSGIEALRFYEKLS